MKHRPTLLFIFLLTLVMPTTASALPPPLTLNKKDNPIFVQNNPFFKGSENQSKNMAPKSNRFTKPLMALQKKINHQLSQYVKAIKEKNYKALLFSILLAALYGVVHAAGPGHRKIIFFSYFATHPHPFKDFATSCYASALLHASSAILLTSILYLTLAKTIGHLVDNVTVATQKITYIFLALFGVAMIIGAIVEWVKNRKEVNANKNLKEAKLWLLVFFSSIIPCPIASTIMIICLQQKIAWLGIVLVLALSVGIGITIFAVALPGYLSSKGIIYLAEKNQRDKGNLVAALDILGGFFLLIFSIIMAL